LVVAQIEADRAGGTDLQVGELIVQVNQRSVWMPDHMAQEVRIAAEGGRAKVLLLVQGVSGFRFSLLPIQ
jgi:hypothetical protein